MAPTSQPVRKTRTLQDAKVKAKAAFARDSAPAQTPPPLRLVAVVVAPLFEEFFYRVLLQGWLEAVWSRRRRKQRKLRTAPLAWVPILCPALFFAIQHFRWGHAPPPPEPSDPKARELARQEREARMMVSDLMEIGMQQRKAYAEAKRKAALKAASGGQ